MRIKFTRDIIYFTQTLFFIGVVFFSFDYAQGATEEVSTTSTSVILTKSVVPSTASVGQEVTYTITYQNVRNERVINVQINDTLPSGVTYITNSASHSGIYNTATKTISWIFSEIAPGVSGSVSFKAVIDEPRQPTATATPTATPTATRTISAPPPSGSVQALRVSVNNRFLIKQDGTPFFWLGDTAWHLVNELTREEVDEYLLNRANKRFTVIQAVIPRVHSGLHYTNVYNQPVAFENDPSRPNEQFFQHVDYVVNKAQSLGLYMAILPTWGNHVRWGPMETEAKARAWGQYIGNRYRTYPGIIWVLGGDDVMGSDTALMNRWRAMAQGIESGYGSHAVITLHPAGGNSSSQWFHDDTWLDFNMFQTGHLFNSPASQTLPNRDYLKTPTKPTLDGEPGYENIIEFENRGRINDWEVRKHAYWSIFAGSFGHTYGSNEIWQFWTPADPTAYGANTHWRDAMQFPGAQQMRHLRALIESRPFLTRIPDQTVITSTIGTGASYLTATRDSVGSYVMVFLPSGGNVTVDMTKISGSEAKAYWYDPREGTNIFIGQFVTTGTRQFSTPSTGSNNDWVLVLDDAAGSFSLPGQPR